MNTVINNPIVGNPIFSVLNSNVIREEKTKDAILAMGMSSCQIRCMKCHCGSKCCGKGH